MRSFEERKAEIFRRSEEKIKQRKKMKKNMIMWSVPLVLSITVLSFAMSLRQDVDESAKESADMEMVNDGASNLGFVGSVEVTSNEEDVYLYYEEEENVEQVENIIQEITMKEVSADMSVASGQSGKTENYSSIESGTIYSIILTNSKGNSTTYLLVNEILIDSSTNLKYELDSEENEKMRSTLGITEE